MPTPNPLLLTGVFAGLLGAQQPPIIDRDAFFGEIVIGGAQISPDGKYIAFLKPYKGVRNVWVKKAGEPFDAAKPVTAETKRPVPGYFWSRDSKYVLYTQDKDGDENYNIYAADPATAGDSPSARNLTDLKGVRTIIYAVPKTDPDVVFIGLNDRDKAWHDLYRLRLSTGEKTLLRKNTDRVTGWIFDNQGQLRLATRSPESGATEVLRVDPDKFTKIYECDPLETCEPVRFDKDNKLAYMTTNKGAGSNLVDLVLLNPDNGAVTPVESDPQKRVDFGNAMFSDLTDELIGTTYEDERERLYWRNKEFEADYQWLQSQLPDMELAFGSHTKDENLWLVSAHSDTEPGATYLVDRKNRKIDLQYKVREKLPREALSTMQPVRYESSDGLEIPAYLTLPKGLPAKNLPLLIVPHGGPWARDGWGYSSIAQFFANRGYAVLQPNFRGSTGYGKQFLNGGNRQWGDKMQDDLTWGAKWLVQKGVADPKRVGILGGSYGGYAALAGVAFTPDVYAAGVSIVGPSNLITLMESIPPYWEQARMIFNLRMGDSKTPEGKKQLERQSPLNSASKIKTPLMVQQGANDPRVNKAESDQIVMALRDRGFPVEYLVMPDEGHGFARPVNMMASMAAAEAFLAKYLGGRAQPGGTPEVIARLKEVTVDPKTVTLPKKVEAAAGSMPKPAVPLQVGSDKYQAKIEMGGQSVQLALSSSVKDDNGLWAVTDTMTTPMGEATETAYLEKGSLVLVRRTGKQGPMTVQIEFKDGKAQGSMDMNGKQTPIQADLGGPLFADSAGALQSIASLPLAEGYTAVFRNFDVQKQKVKLMQLKVAGKESITVGAGTFDAVKVEIVSAEGGPEKVTMWVDPATRKTVKMSAVQPEMGGATVTAELQK